MHISDPLEHGLPGPAEPLLGDNELFDEPTLINEEEEEDELNG